MVSNSNFLLVTGAMDLLKKNLDDLVIERPCLEILQNSEVLDKLQIINGLEPGNITQALKGEHVGTIINKN